MHPSLDDIEDVIWNDLLPTVVDQVLSNTDMDDLIRDLFPETLPQDPAIPEEPQCEDARAPQDMGVTDPAVAHGGATVAVEEVPGTAARAQMPEQTRKGRECRRPPLLPTPLTPPLPLLATPPRIWRNEGEHVLVPTVSFSIPDYIPAAVMVIPVIVIAAVIITIIYT